MYSLFLAFVCVFSSNINLDGFPTDVVIERRVSVRGRVETGVYSSYYALQINTCHNKQWRERNQTTETD